ncbi:40S ribosomal protein S10-like [Macaca thibetana thibetana]|uniref:40S ribosomal protein S10-like n=1 Tax=Macaca thibetana thibetana TaxID=257877 RepID=UPI0021BCBEA9|nr:40S ribosomal protein S10-like [Macaca thibetana thibetana]
MGGSQVWAPEEPQLFSPSRHPQCGKKNEVCRQVEDEQDEDELAGYELLFKEGVMVAKKDVHMPKHLELADKDVPNLHVLKAMQSPKSRGYVKEQFAWRHFYWYLTDEGIQYLRDYLHLPRRLCLPPYATAIQRLAGLSLKGE